MGSVSDPAPRSRIATPAVACGTKTDRSPPPPAAALSTNRAQAGVRSLNPRSRPVRTSISVDCTPGLGEDRADRAPDAADAPRARFGLVVRRVTGRDLDGAPAQQPHRGRERGVLDRVDEAGDPGRAAHPDRHLED